MMVDFLRLLELTRTKMSDPKMWQQLMGVPQSESEATLLHQPQFFPHHFLQVQTEFICISRLVCLQGPIG